MHINVFHAPYLSDCNSKSHTSDAAFNSNNSKISFLNKITIIHITNIK